MPGRDDYKLRKSYAYTNATVATKYVGLQRRHEVRLRRAQVALQQPDLSTLELVGLWEELADASMMLRQSGVDDE